MESWQLFLILTLLCLIFQTYFTMMEMAFVSFNRVRLEYYIKEKNKKAIWLGKLLQKPTYLFGTTLIGVNFFLQMGSEMSRLFYINLGLSPDLAPISQIIIVVIFAELSPMFAARSHAEHVTMLGITPIYILSKLLFPFVWVLNGFCRVIDWILKSPQTAGNYLSREELQSAIEAKDEKHPHVEKEELDTLVKNIFDVKAKSPRELMIPLKKIQMIAYTATVKEVKELLMKNFTPFVPLYYEKRENVFGVIYSRDLLRLSDDAKVKDISRSPWFITEKNSIFQIIKQFRWNNQQLAVVLDEEGNATGILTLDRLIEEIFDNTTHINLDIMTKPQVVIDKTFPADQVVKEINRLFGTSLPTKHSKTLEELMAWRLGHSPQKGDAVRVGYVELTLEEVPFMADKIIRITSL